ncbi:MAG: epoxyqueuosine reductase [Bacteroidia bacterium]|nr:MAG: epoxyqueuosine reductase [Bacteroidia bacterium]
MKVSFHLIEKYFLKYFQKVGVCSIEKLDEEILYLEEWLKKGKQGKMKYLENHFEIRRNPQLLLENAQTAIVVLKGYYQKQKPNWFREDAKISNYAWGKDYHLVIRKQLEEVCEDLKKWIGNFSYRICIDSAPFMDKVWARRAGVGWMGKNTNIIHPKMGSYFFIGTVLVDFKVDYQAIIMKDYCGTCNKCIEACPTQALKPYEIDASQCISYLTIELKEDIPQAFESQLSGWAYGCDICQQVCPWNRFSQEHQEKDFEPLDLDFLFQIDELEALSNKKFQKKLSLSPINRINKQKWLQNLKKIKK